jgi:poly(ADP-ribose) glycohydrolase ARH3
MSARGPSVAVDAGDRAHGALLGTFVGDALGMPFEGAAHVDVPARVEMLAARRGRGTYTDDTQMMIALAESLIEWGRVQDEHLARAFQGAYDPDRGYGGGTRRVFELWASGTSVAAAAGKVFDGQGSRGNGAAMRIAPVAVRFHGDPARVQEEAACSARVTHAHPVGVDGAVVQATAIGAALRDDDILEATRAAARTREMSDSLGEVSALLVAPREPAEVHARLGSSSDARESVCAAVYSALAHTGFEDAARFAVRLGGDTDTVAAMTGAIAGARHGAASIPRRWIEALEDGDRGRTHVEELARRLIAPTSTRARSSLRDRRR